LGTPNISNTSYAPQDPCSRPLVLWGFDCQCAFARAGRDDVKMGLPLLKRSDQKSLQVVTMRKSLERNASISEDLTTANYDL